MFPEFCNDNTTKYDLCLTNDVDSLLSCALLNYLKGYEINYYYDFNALYRMKKSSNPVIFVDCDVTGENYCWSNHATALSTEDIKNINKNAANLNNVMKINRDNYFTKYAGSTILQLMSYYDFDISSLSEETLMLLLCIDVGYKGYYSKYPNDNRAHDFFIREVMEFPELIELEEKYGVDDFYNLFEKYNLRAKIRVNQKGVLETELDMNLLSELFKFPVELPLGDFNKLYDFEYLKLPLKVNTVYTKKSEMKIFSLALTRKNEVCCSRVEA
jgi:hypothetical protein